jgi:hypothetical protein
LDEIPREYLFSITPYAPRMVTPYATEFATQMTLHSWHGQVELLIRNGVARRIHLNGLMLGMKLELDEISKRDKMLLIQRANIQKAWELYETMRDELETTEDREDQITREIDEIHSRLPSEIRDGLAKHNSAFADLDKHFASPGFPQSRRKGSNQKGGMRLSARVPAWKPAVIETPPPKQSSESAQPIEPVYESSDDNISDLDDKNDDRPPSDEKGSPGLEDKEKEGMEANTETEGGGRS